MAERVLDQVAVGAGPVLDGDPERLELEVVGPPAGGPTHEQLEGRVGGLEEVAGRLEHLELLEHLAELGRR